MEKIIIQETVTDSTSRIGVKIPTYYVLPQDNASNKLVVLIHGHHGNHNENGGYDIVANSLAENGIIVAMLDFAGCGASKEDYHNNAMSCMCNDVVDVINDAKKKFNTTKLGLLGYSMGGRILCQLLIDKLANPDSIVFVAPEVSFANSMFIRNGKDNYEKMKNSIKGTDNMYPLESPFGAQPLSNKFFEDFEKYGEDMAVLAAANYSGNSLTIYATNDGVVIPETSKMCADAFKSTVITVNNLDHSYSFYGKDKATVDCLNTAISSFFIDDLN